MATRNPLPLMLTQTPDLSPPNSPTTSLPSFSQLPELGFSEGDSLGELLVPEVLDGPGDATGLGRLLGTGLGRLLGTGLGRLLGRLLGTEPEDLVGANDKPGLGGKLGDPVGPLEELAPLGEDGCWLGTEDGAGLG